MEYAISPGEDYENLPNLLANEILNCSGSYTYFDGDYALHYDEDGDLLWSEVMPIHGEEPVWRFECDGVTVERTPEQSAGHAVRSALALVAAVAAGVAAMM